MIPIWIGPRPEAICSAFKKDLMLQPWQSAQRIHFTFETVWCIVENENDLLLTDGSTLKITTVHCAHGCLIGRDDPYQTGLDYNEAARAFRSALDERNKAQSL